MERCNDSSTAEVVETVDLSHFSSKGLDRGRSRLTEILWWIAKITIVQTKMPWPSAIRKAILRLFGAKIGHGFYIRPSVNVHFPWKLTVGDNVWIGEGCTILNLVPIVIGSNTALAHEVYITSGGHDIRSPDFSYDNRPVLIESGVWLGTRSFVGAGVTVHRGAVVAAGAVVVKNVAAWSIVGGTPARVIGTRSIERSTK